MQVPVACKERSVAVNSPQNQMLFWKEVSAYLLILNQMTVRHTEKIVWLKTCHVQLSKAGRMTLIAFGCQLNDKHITLAQKLLQNRFPNVEGFAPMLMQTKKGQSKITSGIQIIFCHGNHWIAVSNVRSPGDIIIYDSLHVSISEEVKEIVSSLFSHDDLYHWLQCISKNLDPTIVVSLL